MNDEHQQLLDQWILKGRQENPALYGDVKTKAEAEEEARNKARLSKRQFEDVVSRRQPGVATTATVIGGSIAGGFTDPLNLLLLPFGAGAGRSIIKAAMIEGSLNLAAEAVSLPQVMSWQKELGHKYGFAEARNDLATAFVGGAALTAVLRSAGPALRAASDLTGSVSERVLSRLAESERIPGSVRDAARYLSRVAHIDEAVPFHIKDEPELVVHRQTVADTAGAFEQYKQPSFDAKAGTTTLQEFSFRAQSIITEENLARVQRSEAPRLFAQGGTFDSRKQADAFIRETAAATGQKRGDFLIEKTPDGKVQVLRPFENVRLERDSQSGAVRTFETQAEANAYAKELKAKGEQAEAISLNPKAGKSEQTFLVVRGATPEIAKQIKANPDKATFFDPEARSQAAPVTIRPDHAAATQASENVLPLHRSLEANEIAPTTRLAAKRAELDRLAGRDPAALISLEDGRAIPLTEYMREIEDDNNFLEAMKGRVLG